MSANTNVASSSKKVTSEDLDALVGKPVHLKSGKNASFQCWFVLHKFATHQWYTNKICGRADSTADAFCITFDADEVAVIIDGNQIILK